MQRLQTEAPANKKWLALEIRSWVRENLDTKRHWSYERRGSWFFSWSPSDSLQVHHVTSEITSSIEADISARNTRLSETHDQCLISWAEHSYTQRCELNHLPFCVAWATEISMCAARRRELRRTNLTYSHMSPRGRGCKHPMLELLHAKHYCIEIDRLGIWLGCNAFAICPNFDVRELVVIWISYQIQLNMSPMGKRHMRIQMMPLRKTIVFVIPHVERRSNERSLRFVFCLKRVLYLPNVVQVAKQVHHVHAKLPHL